MALLAISDRAERIILNGCLLVVVITSFIATMFPGIAWAAGIVAIVSAFIALITYFGELWRTPNDTPHVRPEMPKEEVQINETPSTETQTRLVGSPVGLVESSRVGWTTAVPDPMWLHPSTHRSAFYGLIGNSKSSESPKVPQTVKLRQLVEGLGEPNVEKATVVTIGAITIEIEGDETKVHVAPTNKVSVYVNEEGSRGRRQYIAPRDNIFVKRPRTH